MDDPGATPASLPPEEAPPPPPVAPQVVTITKIDLPWRTAAKVIAILVLIWLLIRLWPLQLLVVIGVLLAAALDPVVTMLQRRGLTRGRAVVAIFFGIIGLIALLLLLVIPPMIQEASDFAANLPDYVSRTQGLLQSRYPELYRRLEEFAQQQAEGGSVSLPLPEVVSVGAGILQAASNTLLVVAITAYMLTGGQRIYTWSVRYIPDRYELKVRRTLPEISKAVSAYVLGQLILSTSFGIFTFIVLTLVGVEQALFLALLAAFMDAIPMIGVILATIPAVLLALTVSVPAAIIVFVAYIVYQQIENYVISPRVFGDRLKLSPFAILMAVLIGAELLGVLGVLMALPLAAAVPAIERIWIAPLKAGASAESAPETPPSPSDEQPRRSRRLAVPRKQR